MDTVHDYDRYINIVAKEQFYHSTSTVVLRC
jgi:hypothetical protein